jgi:hypothetical protein
MKSSDKIKQNMHRPNGSKWWKLVARRSWCQPTTKVLGDDSSTLGCEEHVILPPILLWFEKVLNHIHTNEKNIKILDASTIFAQDPYQAVLIISRLERELARDVKVHIVNGMSGELAAVARAPSYPAAGDLTGFLGVADPKSSALTVFQVNFMIIS